MSSGIGLVVGIVIFLFMIGILVATQTGPFALSPVPGVKPPEGSGVPGPVVAFIGLFLLACIWGIAYHAWNLFSDDAPGVEDIVQTGGEPVQTRSDQPAATGRPSSRDLLLELEQMRSDHLITEDEYAGKRRQILDDFGRNSGGEV